MALTAAIYHHPDAVESPGTKLAGRRAAGQSFLGGLVRHCGADRLHAVADRQEHLAHFREVVQGFGWTGEVDGSLMHEPQRLDGAEVLMLPGPSLDKPAWTRRRLGQRRYSLCGITHTVATKRVMELFFNLLVAPVESWDAIICTSNAVRSVVAAELEAAESYLTRRLGARRIPQPELPVIPLGIDADRFRPSDEARARWRRRLGVPDDAAVIMSMGRLSVFEKLHPAPLMLAAQLAAERSDVPIVLLMVGWFADKASEQLHHAAASELAPSVTVHFPDGRDAEARDEIWSAADIFALPVDNIQETFGLAPVEAMAAGLPVVCSDWDGFKDTVEDGVTGCRVRTLMSRPGMGAWLGDRFDDGRDNYLQYLGFVQQRTAVDVREMAEAFTALIADAERRRRMGEAGRERARRLYDWSVVIPQYQALWAELSARRERGLPTSEREAGEAAYPAAMDPFTLYAGYPTAALARSAVLSAQRAVGEAEIRHLVELTGAKQLKRMVTQIETVAAVQAAIHRDGPITLERLAAAVGPTERAVEGAVLWLAKFDLVQIDR